MHGYTQLWLCSTNSVLQYVAGEDTVSTVLPPQRHVAITQDLSTATGTTILDDVDTVLSQDVGVQ